jgi:mRNA-degrading endonuclease RelE of RelBE toxin-antitoxin system
MHFKNSTFGVLTKGSTLPPYRLRIAEIRVFYDVSLETQTVIVYGIAHKEHSSEWLAAFTTQDADNGSEL